MEEIVRETTLRLIQGNLVEQDTEAIVNAANFGLLGGGGVDGAIHRAAGPQMLEECKAIRASQGRCPTGKAVITGGGLLKARYVIHAVGPIWFWGLKGEDEQLRSAYFTSLSLACDQGIRSISFPSISTGAYRFPIVRAARIALRTVCDFLQSRTGLEEVRFVLFREPDYRVFTEALLEVYQVDL